MAWVRLRSRRSPAFWAPLAVALLVAALAGLTAQLWATEHLRDLHDLARSDPRSAGAVAERTLRSLALLVGGFAVLVAVLLGRYFQLGLRQGRLPPSGWWSVGAHRAATGATAERLARAGLGLAALLALLGAALPLVVARLVASLLAA